MACKLNVKKSPKILVRGVGVGGLILCPYALKVQACQSRDPGSQG